MKNKLLFCIVSLMLLGSTALFSQRQVKGFDPAAQQSFQTYFKNFYNEFKDGVSSQKHIHPSIGLWTMLYYDGQILVSKQDPPFIWSTGEFPYPETDGNLYMKEPEIRYTSDGIEYFGNPSGFYAYSVAKEKLPEGVSEDEEGNEVKTEIIIPSSINYYNLYKVVVMGRDNDGKELYFIRVDGNKWYLLFAHDVVHQY